jgi:hypothetical protein
MEREKGSQAHAQIRMQHWLEEEEMLKMMWMLLLLMLLLVVEKKKRGSQAHAQIRMQHWWKEEEGVWDVMVVMLRLRLRLLMLLMLPMQLRRCRRLQPRWPPQWRLPVSDCSKEQKDKCSLHLRMYITSMHMYQTHM